MDSILVVSGAASGVLPDLVREVAPFAGISVAASGSEARRMLPEQAFSLAVINSPLPDESGEGLAAMAAEAAECGVILLAPSSYADEIAVQIEDLGVLVLAKPLHRQELYRAVKLVEAANHRLEKLREENILLGRKLDEQRLVGRAKAALIQYRQMTEEQAHRAIEKQAMDRRMTRREVAEAILQAHRDG